MIVNYLISPEITKGSDISRPYFLAGIIFVFLGIFFSLLSGLDDFQKGFGYTFKFNVIMLVMFLFFPSYYAIYNWFFRGLIFVVIYSIIVRVFSESQDDLICELLALVLYFVIMGIIACVNNTKVQFICNFGSGFNNVIEILGVRPLTTEDFVEYYSYDSNNICKVNGTEMSGVVIKISQKNREVNVSLFEDGKPVDKVPGMQVSVGSFGILYVNTNVKNISASDIKIYADTSEYGHYTMTEFVRWLFG